MDKLTIENFRNIKNEITIELSKINILTGTNNSGKSNILKLLSLISDYLSSDNQLVLSFNGTNADKHKIDNFRNIIYWDNWVNNKVFKFSYQRDNYKISFAFSPLLEKNSDTETYEKGRLDHFEFKNFKTNSKVLIKHKAENSYILSADKSMLTELWLSRSSDKNDGLMISEFEKQEKSYKFLLLKYFNEAKELKTDSKEFWKKISHIGFYSGFLKSTANKLSESKVRETEKGNFSLEIEINNNQNDENSITSIIKILFEKFFKSIKFKNENNLESIDIHNELVHIHYTLKSLIDILNYHLNPDRANQARIHLGTELKTEISKIINNHKFRVFKKDTIAHNFLVNWMKQLRIGNDYRFRSIEGIATAVEVKDEFRWHNLVDKGFGAGQLFSLLMRIAELIDSSKPINKNFTHNRLKFPFIISIEEPEANLHPKFQSLLADIFYDAIIIGNIQFVIETHSEYLIRRFQYLVANKDSNLSSEDMKIYYFNENDNNDTEEKFYDLEIRPDGMLKRDFGPGFFDEATNLTIDLLNHQKN